jgi:type VI secretion system protein ImpB
MAEESTQKWLGRNRPPRVQITYDLETGGAIQKKELPLVVGIIADLAGETSKDEVAADLKPRKFVEIDRDNFSDVMRSIDPTLTVKGQVVHFHSVDDFTPDNLVENVKALNDLLKLRQQLNDLLARVDGNDALDRKLFEVSKSPDELQKALPAKPAEGGS